MIKENYREFKGTINEKAEDGVPLSWLETITVPSDTRISQELSTLIIEFICQIKKKFKFKQILHLSNSTMGIFNTIDGPNIKHGYLFFGDSCLNMIEEESGQLLLCDLSAEDEQISPPPYDILGKILNKAKENVRALIVASEKNLSTFRKIIEENDTSINSIFQINISKKFTSQTNLLDGNGSVFIPFESGLYFILVQNKKNKKEFIFKINSIKDINKIIEEVYLGDKTQNPIYGVMLNSGEYQGEKTYQRSLKMSAALNKIENSFIDYKAYPRKKLGELGVSFKIKEHKEQSNATLGNFLYINVSDFEKSNIEKPIFYTWEKFTIQPEQKFKNRNYLCIEFDGSHIESEYLKYFFESTIGSLIRESISAKEFLSLEDIKNLWIYVPPLDSQRGILATINKIDESKKNLHNINFDLILNPSAFDDANKKINKILDVFGELADFEKVKSRIYEGESKTLEFKQTFSVDISNNKKEKYIEDACIKTIAAFMNSDGGVLMVGVADNGDLIGLDSEISKFHKNSDAFLLHVKNQIKNRIGEQFYPFINYRLVRLENKTILYVESLPSNSEVYVDSKDFYVRTNPATDKLEGPKLVNYIKNHRNFVSP